jgi:hypothetical protein
MIEMSAPPKSGRFIVEKGPQANDGGVIVDLSQTSPTSADLQNILLDVMLQTREVVVVMRID